MLKNNQLSKGPSCPWDGGHGYLVPKMDDYCSLEFPIWDWRWICGKWQYKRRQQVSHTLCSSEVCRVCNTVVVSIDGFRDILGFRVGVWSWETVEWSMEGCPVTWVTWSETRKESERPSRTFGGSLREWNGGLGVCCHWLPDLQRPYNWSKNAICGRLYEKECV